MIILKSVTKISYTLEVTFFFEGPGGKSSPPHPVEYSVSDTGMANRMVESKVHQLTMCQVVMTSQHNLVPIYLSNYFGCVNWREWYNTRIRTFLYPGGQF